MITFGNSFIVIDTTWEDVRDSSVYSGMHYAEEDGKYDIFTINNVIVKRTSLFTGLAPQILVDSGFSQEANDLNKQDFEENYKSGCNKELRSRVTSDMELNNKTLKASCAYAQADENGVVVVTYISPSCGRYVAFGDAEFETKHFKDRISLIEIMLPDDTVIRTYHEHDIPVGSDFVSGMAMTFTNEATEVEPIGGYGFVPEGFKLRITAVKGNGSEGAGCWFKVSLDCAEGDA